MSDPEFLFLGDALWLDFVNTARRHPNHLADRLPDAAAYRRWTAARRLRHDGTPASFPDILDFRRRLTALADALSADQRPASAAVEAINALLAAVPGNRLLTRINGTWRLDFSFPSPPPALVAIADSAARTLADAGTQVRCCAADGCELFLLDDTMTQSRRFCQASCGGSRFVERRRGTAR